MSGIIAGLRSNNGLVCEELIVSFPLPPDIRRATTDDVSAIRRLVNDAYRELEDLGLNFTGTYQDEQTTFERMQGAEVYLLYRQNELVASINISLKE